VSYLDIVSAQLKVDEGFRTKPYVDTAGKITIGIGRNLTDNGVNRGEIALMFDNDLVVAETGARMLVPRFDALSDARKAVLMNMVFNMGYARVALFVKTLKAINDGRFSDAAAEMRASIWYEQTGDRAKRLVAQMEGDTA
jgi:lysozyme